MRYKSEVRKFKNYTKTHHSAFEKNAPGCLLVQLASGEEFTGPFNFLYSLSSLQLTLIFVTNQKEGAFRKRGV